MENLAARTPGLILLTATPEQLGRSGHFARLRLLDPARYHDLRSYVAEADSFTGLSEIAGRLNDGEPLSSDDVKALAGRFGDDEQLTSLLAKPLDAAATNTVLDALIDRHGTGRVMFRNRRGQVGGFPAVSRNWSPSMAASSTTRNASTCLPNSMPTCRPPRPRSSCPTRMIRA